MTAYDRNEDATVLRVKILNAQQVMKNRVKLLDDLAKNTIAVIAAYRIVPGDVVKWSTPGEGDGWEVAICTGMDPLNWSCDGQNGLSTAELASRIGANEMWLGKTWMTP